MFKTCCGDCGECWYVGNPRTCTCPDETTKRKWVDLSDEDIWEAYMESTVELDCSIDELYALSRTVEAKLKDKNTRGQK